MDIKAAAKNPSKKMRRLGYYLFCPKCKHIFTASDPGCLRLSHHDGWICVKCDTRTKRMYIQYEGPK